MLKIDEFVSIKPKDEINYCIFVLPGRGQSGSVMSQNYESFSRLKQTLFVGMTPQNFAWYPMPFSAVDQEEAVEVLKKNIEQLKSGENVDEETIKTVDFFLSKIDSLSENWEKASKQIDSLIDDKHENSKLHKNLLAKTLFFGMNKLNEIDSILKENEGKISDEQKQSFEELRTSILYTVILPLLIISEVFI